MTDTITRGTTSQIILPIDGSVPDFEALYVTFTQLGQIVLEKTIDDVTIDSTGLGGIVIDLTQEDTLAFSDTADVEVQVRGKTATGSAYASEIEKVSVGRILKDGVI